MGNTIATVASLDSLTAGQRQTIRAAYSTLKGLELTDYALTKGVSAVGKIRGLGYSVRGTLAVLSLAGDGSLPLGKGTIERLGYVSQEVSDAAAWPFTDGDTVTRTVKGKAETVKAAEAIVRGLYRVSQTGTAADVKRAAELGRKATTAQGASDAIAAVVGELNAAEHKSLTTPPVREVGGNAADGGKAPAGAGEQEQSKAPAGGPAEHTTAEVIAAASTGTLIAELGKRFKGRAATVAGADVEAFTALLARVEALIAADKITR